MRQVIVSTTVAPPFRGTLDPHISGVYSNSPEKHRKVTYHIHELPRDIIYRGNLPRKCGLGWQPCLGEGVVLCLSKDEAVGHVKGRDAPGTMSSAKRKPLRADYCPLRILLTMFLVLATTISRAHATWSPANSSAVWDPADLNSTIEGNTLLDVPLFGPNDTVKLISMFQGGFWDFVPMHFAAEYVSNNTELDIRIEMLTQNFSFDATSEEVVDIANPFFQSPNNIIAWILPKDPSVGIDLVSLISANGRLLLTDGIDKDVTEHSAVFSFEPGRVWETLAMFLRACRWMHFVTLLDGSSLSQHWGIEWIKTANDNGLHSIDSVMFQFEAIHGNRTDAEPYYKYIGEKLQFAQAVGARVIVWMMTLTAWEPVLHVASSMGMTSGDYVWICARCMVDQTPVNSSLAVRYNMNIFGGGSVPVDYMAFPEGQAMAAAWEQYSGAALQMPNAPSLNETVFTPDDWRDVAWDAVEKVTIISRALSALAKMSPNITIGRSQRLLSRHIINDPWFSTNGMLITNFTSTGARANRTREVTVFNARQDGEVVATYVNNSVFSVYQDNIWWPSGSPPPWDVHCLEDTIRDVRLGYGCIACPVNFCVLPTGNQARDTCVPCQQGLRMFNLAYVKTLAVVTFVLIGVLVIATIYYRKEHIIKAAAPRYLLLMLAGGVITVVPGFFQSKFTGAWNCYADRWVTYFGETIMFSAIAAKTYRIWRLFNNPNLRQNVYKTWHVALIFIIFNGVAIIFALVYLLLGLLDNQDELVSSPMMAGGFYMDLCKDSWGQELIIYLVLGYMVLVPLSTAIFGFNLKRILDRQGDSRFKKFDELREIMNGTSFFLAIIVVLVPIEIYNQSQKTYSTTETSYITFYVLYAMGTIILLGGIMIPKFYNIYLEKHDTKQQPELTATAYVSSDDEVTAPPTAADSRRASSIAQSVVSHVRNSLGMGGGG